jgi:hypothetical protein
MSSAVRVPIRSSNCSNSSPPKFDRPRPFVPLPFVFAQPMGSAVRLGVWLIPFAAAADGRSGDDAEARQCRRRGEAGTIADLGRHGSLESVEAIVPSYLWRFRPYGQFQTKQNPA